MNNFRPQRFSLLPPVIKNLLILNGLFFLAKLSLGSVFNVDLDSILGLHYPFSDEFKPFQFITYMFMHADFLHIFMNMFVLWMFGVSLENMWGPKKFLVFYIITGLGAALVHYIVYYFEISPILTSLDLFIKNPTVDGIKYLLTEDHINLTRAQIEMLNQSIASNNTQAFAKEAVQMAMNYKNIIVNQPVVVGASGAVFGVLMAYGLLFPNNLIYIYFIVPLKAKYLVLIIGAMELYRGVSGTGDNVANFAHLGGMLFGFIVLYYWGYLNKRY